MYSLVPIWFVCGLAGLMAVLGLAALLWRSRRQAFFSYMVVAAIVYTVLFWFVIGLTTNIERDYVFNATWRLTPGSTAQGEHIVTLEYQDYPGRFEKVNSEAIHNHLASSRASVVPITVRVSYDFGNVRGYSLERVDNLPANEAWISGTPPWEVFRTRPFATRWLRFVKADSPGSRQP